MIARLCAAACLLELAACAQLSLLQIDPQTKVETPVTTSLMELGTVAPGDTLVTSFHVKNLGNTPASMVVNVAGAGFKLTIYDLNPCILPAATTTVTTRGCGYFDVLFSPTAVGPIFSALLTINTVSVTLRGGATPEAVLSYGGLPLAANAAIDFGQVERGNSSVKSFTISNPYSAPVHVSSLAVSGTAFSGPGGLSTPVDLPPGASFDFQITFQPQGSGRVNGTLQLDQRSYSLTGTGTLAPLPKGTIVVSSQAAVSGQQLNVTIALATTAQVAGSGTLTLAFQPAPGLPDDAAVQFLSGAKRNASVAIAAGDDGASIDGQKSLTFQTGTTAGRIVLTLTLPNSSDQYTIPIPGAMVNVNGASGSRRIDAIDVSIAGFDNTRTVSQLAFTFYDAGGRMLQPGVIRVDATSDFKQYFATSPAGGAFALLATFPVTGNSSQVAGVDVQMSNSVGITNTQRIAF